MNVQTTFEKLCGCVPTTIIMRHDGPSLDIGPEGRADAVLFFPSTSLAVKFQRLCGLNPDAFPVTELSIHQWVATLRELNDRGMRWMNIVLSLENNEVGKTSVSIDEVLDFAAQQDGGSPGNRFWLN